MTALSDALEAAQARAVQSVAKAFVADVIDQEEAARLLHSFGLDDPTDTAYWFGCLVALKQLGAGAPAETNGAAKREDVPATKPQREFIGKLLSEKGISPDDFPNKPNLSKQDAHEIIESLQRGDYDPAKWTVPF